MAHPNELLNVNSLLSTGGRELKYTFSKVVLSQERIYGKRKYIRLEIIRAFLKVVGVEL